MLSSPLFLARSWCSTTRNITKTTSTLSTPPRLLMKRPVLLKRESLYKLPSSLTAGVCCPFLFPELLSCLSIHSKGHINHSLFWKNLAPSASEGKGVGGKLQSGAFKDAVEKTFGSVDNFKKEFNAATLGIQGSGWGWLVRHLIQPENLLSQILSL
jgi:superoxide dismutase